MDHSCKSALTLYCVTQSSSVVGFHQVADGANLSNPPSLSHAKLHLPTAAASGQ